MKAGRILVGIAVVVAVSACGGQREAPVGASDGGRLTIATGNTTGVYYALGGAMASIISDQLDGYRATASETGASVQNVQGLTSGNYDIAFCLADTATDAVKGENTFDTPQDVVALANLYPNYMHVVVRAGAGITKLSELKGKRVSTGSPNSGTEVAARRVLAAVGIDHTTGLVAQRLGLPESVEAMKSGSIDALFWSGGLPTAGITDLTTSMGSRVQFLSIVDLLPTLQRAYGEVYQAGTIPSKTYAGTTSDTKTILTPNLLLVRQDMPDELASKLTRLLLENLDGLVKVNPAAKAIGPGTAGDTGEVPLHPGAKAALGSLG